MNPRQEKQRQQKQRKQNQTRKSKHLPGHVTSRVTNNKESHGKDRKLPRCPLYTPIPKISTSTYSTNVPSCCLIQTDVENVKGLTIFDWIHSIIHKNIPFCQLH